MVLVQSGWEEPTWPAPRRQCPSTNPTIPTHQMPRSSIERRPGAHCPNPTPPATPRHLVAQLLTTSVVEILWGPTCQCHPLSHKHVPTYMYSSCTYMPYRSAGPHPRQGNALVRSIAECGNRAQPAACRVDEVASGGGLQRTRSCKTRPIELPTPNAPLAAPHGICLSKI